MILTMRERREKRKSLRAVRFSLIGSNREKVVRLSNQLPDLSFSLLYYNMCNTYYMLRSSSNPPPYPPLLSLIPLQNAQEKLSIIVMDLGEINFSGFTLLFSTNKTTLRLASRIIMSSHSLSPFQVYILERITTPRYFQALCTVKAKDITFPNSPQTLTTWLFF